MRGNHSVHFRKRPEEELANGESVRAREEGRYFGLERERQHRNSCEAFANAIVATA